MGPSPVGEGGRVTLPVEILIRDAKPSDHALILHSWLKTGVDSQYARAIGTRVWFAMHERLIREVVIPRATLRVACLPEDPDVILAWCCYEGAALHYVYCKGRWQKLGIVRELLAQCGPFVVATHKADASTRYPYNLYPLFLGQSWQQLPESLANTRSPTRDPAQV